MGLLYCCLLLKRICEIFIASGYMKFYSISSKESGRMWVDLFKNRISKDWETVVIPLLFVVIVFAFYSLLGYERELQWHSVRKGLEAVAFFHLFLS